MGILIDRKAGVTDIRRDVDLTLTAARQRGDPYLSDAERHLAASVTVADEVAAKHRAAQAIVDALVARQKVQAERADALVARHRDTLFNAIHRSAKDPLFQQLFPRGVQGYTKVPAPTKAASLEKLARLLENTTHPLIPKALAAPMVNDLRAVSDELEASSRLLGSARTELGLIEAQRAATAREAQTQLTRLKRYWRSTGMSETEVHAIIPDRPARKARKAKRAAVHGSGEASPAHSAGPALTLVRPLTGPPPAKPSEVLGSAEEGEHTDLSSR